VPKHGDTGSPPLVTTSEGLRRTAPTPAGSPELTDLLRDWRRGDAAAGRRLIRLVYPRLKAIAAAQLRRERGNVSVQPTELVHELYLDLVGGRQPEWQDRQHFFAVATVLLRRVLVARARRRGRQKRGGGVVTVPLEDAGLIAAQVDEVDVLDVDRALTELSRIDAEAARLVELRFFGGLTLEEAASVLHVGRATASRRWRAARAFLRQFLRERHALEG
jgi:RNA polymerase sigma factor (TIGR02999 family)